MIIDPLSHHATTRCPPPSALRTKATLHTALLLLRIWDREELLRTYSLLEWTDVTIVRGEERLCLLSRSTSQDRMRHWGGMWHKNNSVISPPFWLLYYCFLLLWMKLLVGFWTIFTYEIKLCVSFAVATSYIIKHLSVLSRFHRVYSCGIK
jgi:hypothetical protein